MTVSKVLKNLGPGLLFAGAAVGVSHLIQSTRAGASYGFDLVWIVLLVNLFKYPFFEIGQRYTTVMGESTIRGYKRLGDWAVWLFLILNVFLSIITIAALTFVSAAIFNYLYFLFAGVTLTPELTSVVYLSVVVMLLFVGKYNLFEKFVKYLVISLSLFTLIAFGVALFTSQANQITQVPPAILSQAGIGFLLALMGWMPAPLELSSWTSLWSLENDKSSGTKKTFEDSILDFNIGYALSAVLAVVFLGLGALVMHGSGEVFSDSAVGFTGQLMSLYTSVIGDWSQIVIAFIIFVTMFSTVITCVDAYPRSLSEAVITVKNLNEGSQRYYWSFMIVIVVLATVIITLLTSSLTLFIDIVTITAFLSSPVIAYLNFKLVRQSFFPAEYRPKKWLSALTYFGLFCFTGFALLYLYSRLFMG